MVKPDLFLRAYWHTVALQADRTVTTLSTQVNTPCNHRRAESELERRLSPPGNLVAHCESQLRPLLSTRSKHMLTRTTKRLQDGKTR